MCYIYTCAARAKVNPFVKPLPERAKDDDDDEAQCVYRGPSKSSLNKLSKNGSILAPPPTPQAYNHSLELHALSLSPSMVFLGNATPVSLTCALHILYIYCRFFFLAGILMI